MPSRHVVRKSSVLAAFVLAALSQAPAAAAQTPALVDLHGFGPRQVRTQPFALNAPQDLQIEAVGAESDQNWGNFTWVRSIWNGEREARPRPWAGNAWILDLQTRKVVWELSSASTSRGGRGTRAFSGTVRLPQGSYAAYYAAYPDGAYVSEDGSVKSGRNWRWIGGDSLEEFKVVVRGAGQPLSAADVERIRRNAMAGEIVALRPSSGEQFQQAGFILDRAAEIEMYAIGEVREDSEFDYGWIINADTRLRIWKLSWRESTPAGGADKNRTATVKRTLPAGRYVAFFATDDSHHPSEWNSPPPRDPDFWGLTIRVSDPAARAAVKSFAYELVPQNATIVALTRIGNSESRKQGFTLNRAMDVRVYAIGEGRDGQMFDYGWITSADTRRRVWEMRYAATEGAGGDPKNRVVDTTLHLEKGSYVVHFISDGSHSSGDWNAAAPADGSHWGITVLSAQGSLDRSAVGLYAEQPDTSVIAQLTEVRDDDQLRKRFTLDRETDVRIYSVGEGTGGNMDDYGWIEDARTGRRVWEMTYKMTEHAGGASKNRRFEGTIKLPAGEYVLRFETDGSHSFGSWNAAPPDDPEAWGITLYKNR